MDTTVVGRDRALGATRAFLTAAREGPQALLVEGDAGIGKTTVWLAAVDAARADGRRVLDTIAEPVEARMSFVALADLIGDCYDEVRSELPGPQREALDQALLRGSVSAAGSPDRRTIGTALRSALIALAARGPIVIAVDDIQWLDGASAQALAFALRRLDGHPVGVLATHRVPPADGDWLALRRAVGEQRFTRIALGPLTPAALRTIVQQRLGFTYPAPVLRRVVDVCAGNPMFALEIARGLGPDPAIAPGRPLPVPEQFHELLAARIADLSAAGRQALLVAASLSHPAAELIEQAASPAGLESAATAGLLRVRDGRVTFAHPLYAAATQAQATTARLRALHARLARLVKDPEERARHLALATVSPDPAVAATIEEAAVLARTRGAWSSAAELLEQARRLTPTSERAHADALTVRAAEHHIYAGDRPRARALLHEALSRGARGSLRADALRLLADASYHEHSFAEAERLLEQALAVVEDPSLEVSIELTIAYVLCNHLEDFPGALAHAERGLQTAIGLGDDGLRGDALAVLAMVRFLTGHGPDWEAVRTALALEDPSRVVTIERRPSWIAALLEAFTGRLGEARAELTALRTVTERSGDETGVAQILYWLAWVEGCSGELDRAVSLAGQSLVLAGLAGSEQTRAWAWAHLAHVHALRGDAVATRSAAAAATEICTTVGHRLPMIWVAAALGQLELSLGDPAAAWAAVSALLEPVERDGIGEPFLVFLPAALEALIGLGELDRAERLLLDFEQRAVALDRVWARALAGRCRGLLLAQRGDLTGARAALADAIDQHARQPMPFELGRTLLVQAQVLRRARARRQARESLEQSLTLLDEIGAARWAGHARAELARIAAVRRSQELTATEQRVTRLAADGLSNKAIAAALFVSVHTVEVHLSHAYAKLGIGSRRQLPLALLALASHR